MTSIDTFDNSIFLTTGAYERFSRTPSDHDLFLHGSAKPGIDSTFSWSGASSLSTSSSCSSSSSSVSSSSVSSSAVSSSSDSLENLRGGELPSVHKRPKHKQHTLTHPVRTVTLVSWRPRVLYHRLPLKRLPKNLIRSIQPLQTFWDFAVHETPFRSLVQKITHCPAPPIGSGRVQCRLEHSAPEIDIGSPLDEKLDDPLSLRDAGCLEGSMIPATGGVDVGPLLKEHFDHVGGAQDGRGV